jgi:predicted hydrocarbon binding protein
MAHSINSATPRLLALSPNTLVALRSALVAGGGPSAAASLQEAGYAGGEDVFTDFQQWLRDRGEDEANVLGVEEFAARASEYFGETGWGAVSIGALHDAVATVDCEQWSEADMASHPEQSGCHLTTGMFANFFGHLSDTPLAVLEVECRSMGAPRCRFLLGNSEVMGLVYEGIEQGLQYGEAAERQASGIGHRASGTAAMPESGAPPDV